MASRDIWRNPPRRLRGKVQRTQPPLRQHMGWARCVPAPLNPSPGRNMAPSPDPHPNHATIGPPPPKKPDWGTALRAVGVCHAIIHHPPQTQTRQRPTTWMVDSMLSEARLDMKIFTVAPVLTDNTQNHKQPGALDGKLCRARKADCYPSEIHRQSATRSCPPRPLPRRNTFQ